MRLSKGRRVLCSAVLAAPWAVVARALSAPNSTPTLTKVLRVAFEAAESGFDPARHGDFFSATVQAHIFEPLFTYDPLARPVKLVPLTAAGPAEPADDFRTWIVRVHPGIFFTNHASFNGQRRELTAADYMYSFKRFVDPVVNSNSNLIPDLRIRGLAELRRKALDSKQPFDYDREIDGLRALDRYTLRIRVEEPRPRLPQTLADSGLGALAREVVEAHGAQIVAHPIGTGPYRLTQWRRSSQIVLERNLDYRERFFDADPAADDAEGQAILKQLKGRRIPMIDRVEIAVIDEDQPRWLAFLNGELDMLEVPGHFAQQAMPGGKLAPYLARRGVRGHQGLAARIRMLYFNMDDPVVGGYTPEKVALRRAIALGMNTERENDLVWGRQAVTTHSVLAPHTSGFDPAFRSEMGEYSPARAKALLDLYGYLDRDGDGWREQLDGKPLWLEKATSSDQTLRRVDEGFQRDMQAIGLRVRFRFGQFSENIKAARAGKLMMWSLGYIAEIPDGHSFLARYYSKTDSFSRFKLPAMDAVYDQLGVLPDGAQREALFLQAQRLAIAWMPYKFTAIRIETHLTQRRLLGFRKALFRDDWFHLVDLDDRVVK